MLNDMKKGLDQIIEIIDYLDSKGYALLLTKKPKRYSYESEIRTHEVPKEKWLYGENIIGYLRECEGLTVKEFAKKLGVSTSLIYQVEKSTRISYNTLKKFAEYFNCTCEELVMKPKEEESYGNQKQS